MIHEQLFSQVVIGSKLFLILQPNYTSCFMFHLSHMCWLVCIQNWKVAGLWPGHVKHKGQQGS